MRDATLSALELADPDGNPVELTPAFDADVPVYRARVANAVEAVTVTATKNEAFAGDPVFLDGTDATLTDADGVAAGFQFALAEGDNTIRVRVTAADLVTTETYTVVVTRARPTLPPLPPPMDVLVSNTDQTVSISHSSDRQAQSFGTGDNTAGYTLTSIEVRLTSVTGTTTSVTVRENNSSNEPGDLVATLTNPVSLSADSLNTFTVPSGTTVTLDANETTGSRWAKESPGS